MSYKLMSARKDRVAARFLAQVHAAISQAAVKEKSALGLTQTMVAQELGVDKSFISRILKGTGNPTVRTIGELSAVLGYRPELVLHKVGGEKEASNIAVPIAVGNPVRRREPVGQNTSTIKSSSQSVVYRIGPVAQAAIMSGK